MSANVAAIPALLAWDAVAAALAARIARELAASDAPGAVPVGLLGAAAGTSALACGADAGAALVCCGLTAAATVDAASGYLVDELTLPSIALGLGAACLAGGQWRAVEGLVALALPAAATVLASRERLLGWGDVKAVAALGAGLGTERALAAIGWACALGALWALASRRRTVRFGPYLAAGAAAALFAAALAQSANGGTS